MAAEGSPMTPVERRHVERALEYYNDALIALEEAEAYLGWWIGRAGRRSGRSLGCHGYVFRSPASGRRFSLT